MRWIFLLCLMAGAFGHSSWNEEFDLQTEQLLEHFPNLKSDQYQLFTHTRKRLLNDEKLYKKVAKEPLNVKKIWIYPKDLLVIKKRRNNHIHELFAWEVACLLGGSLYVTPSFPLEVAGKRVIIQKLEPLVYRKEKITKSFTAALKKVSLITYWKAHLTAYILGLGDLAACNIGISPEGQIRFFDTESSFSYHNHPIRTSFGFTTGFIAESLEWPQYEEMLDERAEKSLQDFVEGLAYLEEQIDAYRGYRSFDLSEEGLRYRLNKVRNFTFCRGRSFRDFYAEVYPRIALGLDELSQIVSRIYREPVGHGRALFFICRYANRTSLAIKEKKRIEEWLNRYVD